MLAKVFTNSIQQYDEQTHVLQDLSVYSTYTCTEIAFLNLFITLNKTTLIKFNITMQACLSGSIKEIFY